MPWDSVPAFLESARAARLFPPEALDALAALDMNDWTFRRLAESEPLVGILDAYQAERLSHEKPHDVLVGLYSILADLGPFAGGTTFRALHPIVRTAVVLRRYDSTVFTSSESKSEFVRTAREASLVAHPFLLELYEAFEQPDGTVVATFAEFDGGNLRTLTEDIGPMPAPLAIHYTLCAGQALAAVHERGLVHGGVIPDRLLVGPLSPMSKLRADGTPKLRPAANATLKLADLGLVFPLAASTPADDVHGLAGSLHFLLTARMPESSNAAASLKALRPDVSEAVVALLAEAFSEERARRPGLASFLQALEATTTAGAVAAPSLADLVDAALDAKSGIHGPTRSDSALLLPIDSVESIVGSVSDGVPVLPYGGYAAQPTRPIAENAEVLEYVPDFYPNVGEDHPEPLEHDSPVRARGSEPTPGRSIWIWIGLAVGLQLFAVLLWIVYVTQPFSGSSPSPTPTPKKQK